MDDIYIVRFSAWACGIKNADEWRQWASGEREMVCDNEGPDISYTDSMFRRRLSRISKMTVQVVHDLLPLDENTKMFFLSFRGEISKQLKINKMVLEEKSLTPAVFSLSVFNTPVALASIAFGLKGGYSALYPGNNSLSSGLAAVKAALLGGTNNKVVFIYADEEIPQEYKNIITDNAPPFAFAMLLSRFPESHSVPFSAISKDINESPQDLLKNLVLCGELHAS